MISTKFFILHDRQNEKITTITNLIILISQHGTAEAPMTECNPKGSNIFATLFIVLQSLGQRPRDQYLRIFFTLSFLLFLLPRLPSCLI